MAPPVVAKQEEKSELSQLKARLDQLEAENKVLRNERTEIEAEAQAIVARRLAGNGASRRELKPEHKGARTYKLTQRHYRLGRLYEVGELITVTDEIPAKNWVPVSATAAPEVIVVPVATKPEVPSV